MTIYAPAHREPTCSAVGVSTVHQPDRRLVRTAKGPGVPYSSEQPETTDSVEEVGIGRR
jgi:hypothetical protein